MIPIALIRILSAVSAWTLPQSVTNGDSKWGTLDAPRLPEFRKPGSPFTDQDGTYSSIPSTGVVRRYNFTIHTAHFMPDGVPKEMMVVNNQFPGPMIEANWGDWIEGQYFQAWHEI